MKKILGILSAIAFVASSTSTAVSCSPEIKNEPDLDNWDSEDIVYRLFEKDFKTKNEAVNYYLNNEREINQNIDYKNDIRFGNQKFESIEEMYSYIEDIAKIKKITTQKNVDEHLVDSLGSISNSGITNNQDIIKVYKDSNGNSVYHEDEAKAIEKVTKSYKDKIINGYEADGNFFSSREQLKAYYQQKYLDESQITEDEYYQLGNFWYKKENYEEKLEDSILESVTYNDVVISEENRFNLSRIKLKDNDFNKITELETKPGIYYIQTNPLDDGILEIDGGNFQKTTENISEMIMDLNNWEKTESKNTGMGDVIMNSAVMGLGAVLGSLGFYETLSKEKLQKIDNFFEACKSYHTKYENYLEASEKLVSKKSKQRLNNEMLGDQMKGILKKYQLLSQINNLWDNLNKFTELDQNKKMTVVLYNIRELLRSVDVNAKDRERIDNFFYNSMLAMNVFSFNKKLNTNNNSDTEMSMKWVEFVEEAWNNGDIYFVLDLLMDPNFLGEKRSTNSSANKFAEYVKFTQEKKDELMEWLKLIEDILKKVETVINSVAKITKVLSKGMVWFSAATELLNSIPVQNTSTYQFTIPDTKNKIIYRKTSWIWELKDFNPIDVIKTLKLSDPIRTKTYLYNETYFTNYNDAIDKLKTDIVNNLFANASNIKYVSKFYDQISDKNKNNLIRKLRKLSQVKNAYSNGFGEIKFNKTEAINSAIEKISNEDFKRAYIYENLGIKIYGYDLKELEKTVEDSINFETKLVEFTDMLTNQKFEKLKNLENEGYEVWTFKFNGKTHYFRDYNGAVVKYMQLNDFENALIQVTESVYKFKNKTFYNTNEFIKYLTDNIQEVKVW